MIELYPYLPSEQRQKVNKLIKQKSRSLVLAESVFHFTNHLSNDLRDTTLLLENNLPFCSIASGDGGRVIRAAMAIRDSTKLHDGYMKTPITALGKTKAVLSVPAADIEKGYQDLWSEVVNLVSELTNENMRKIVNLTKDEDMGKWEARYLAHTSGESHKQYLTPKSRGSSIPRGFSAKDKYEMSTELEDEELEFYKSLQDWCRLHPGEKLEYQPLPFVIHNIGHVQGSYGDSYDSHADCESDMISIDPKQPKILSNGIQLPYRSQMAVGTSCLGWKNSKIDTNLIHGKKNSQGKFVAVTKVVTGANSGHLQQAGLQDKGTLHAGIRVKNQPEPSVKIAKKQLMLADIIDSGVPKDLIPKANPGHSCYA